MQRLRTIKPQSPASADASIAFPQTYPDRYVSGITALNIPSPTGTGDWHMTNLFFRARQQMPRLFIVGQGCDCDTIPLLGERGIFECSSVLDEFKIPHPPGPAYAADHARAIADMVLISILGGGLAEYVQLDDWMPRDEDKQRVFDLLQVAVEKLDHEAYRGAIRTWSNRSWS